MTSPPLLRNSERSTFKQCRQKWDWNYNDGLQPKTPMPPLRFGTLVHKALADFYKPGLKRGPKPAERFEFHYNAELKDQLKFGFKDEDGTWHDAGHLGVSMMEAYWDEYGKDDRYKVLLTEYPFQMPAINPRNGRVLTIVTGVVDGVWLDRTNKSIWIADHKTTKSMPKEFEYLQLDEQAGTYWSYGVDWLRENGLLAPDQRLSGMLYNFIRKGKKDERKTDEHGRALNQDGSVSKQQPAPMFKRPPIFRDEPDREAVRRRVLNEAREIAMVRAGKLAVYKNPSRMNCGGCGFREMCELHEVGADWEGFRDAAMTTWDPYAEHEVYDGR